MTQENDILKVSPRPMFIPLVITQAVCIVTLLLGVVAVKYISPKNFKKVRYWCAQNILDEVDLDKMFDGENNEI